MRNRGAMILAGVLLVAFGYGLVRLMTLRFETGAAYPPYSSLRADPLGTAALYESLDALAGIDASRNYQDIPRDSNGLGKTMVLAGTSPMLLTIPSSRDLAFFREFVSSGGRLVLAFAAEEQPDPLEYAMGIGEDANEAGDESSIAREWQIQAVVRSYDPNAPVTAGPDAPSALADIELDRWYSPIGLDPRDGRWRAILLREGVPVALEREIGRGSVVVLGDSYPLSNEALVASRHTELIAWILGGSRQVIFDETHLGVREHVGTASLARRYGLTGTFLVLVTMALLFVWKNASRLAPPHAIGVARGHTVGGRDSAAGLINLLRRALPGSQLLGECVSQWTRTVAPRRADAEKKAQRLREHLARNKSSLRGEQLVQRYHELSDIASERK